MLQQLQVEEKVFNHHHLRTKSGHSTSTSSSPTNALLVSFFVLVVSHLKQNSVCVFMCNTGSYTPNPFDQMATASMIGGFAATIRSVPPASHIYLTTGKAPYVNFYHIIEVALRDEVGF